MSKLLTRTLTWLCILSMLGCTSMRAVPLDPGSGQPEWPIGKPVKVTTAKGQPVRGTLDRVTDEVLVVDGREIPRASVVELEQRRLAPIRTTLAVTVVGTLVVGAIAADRLGECFAKAFTPGSDDDKDC